MKSKKNLCKFASACSSRFRVAPTTDFDRKADFVVLPIRDNIPTRSVPLVTLLLIAANCGIFVMCAMLPEGELERVVFKFGYIPAKLTNPEAVHAFYARHYRAAVPEQYTLVESLAPMFTCIFLHSGLFHLIGNMWMLWIFGDNVEDRLGKVGFLLFYLACGLAASASHGFSASGSPVPTVGASGAISGVMGAYMVLYPGARVLTLIPIFPFLLMEYLPAFLFLVVWIVFQVLSALASVGLGAVATSGVAWWAHIGGFAVGAGFILITGIRSNKPVPRNYRRAGYRTTSRRPYRPRRRQ